MPESKQRAIDGPDKESLEDFEAAKWLGLSLDKFRELVRDEKIPPADVEVSRQEKYWRWDTVWAAGRLLGFLVKRTRKPGSESGELP